MGFHIRVLQLLISFLLFTSQFGTSTWWYLSQFDTSVGNPKILCSMIPNLHPKQRRICLKRSDVILAIGESMRDAIAECQFHFQFYKWNCSTFTRDSSVFGKNFIKGGTSELAFLQALTTASAVLTVSRACSDGSVQCGCTLSTMEEGAYSGNGFKWNGCTESTKFALNFVRRFTDAGEIEQRDPKAKMTIYNNKAGRESILRQSVTRCKCHGLSGSCTMRSCWRFLPNLRTIGYSLKENYDGAIRVEFDPKGQILTVDNLQRKPTRANLIYFEGSPDGCVLDYSRGLLGTSGRICNSTSEGVDSCDILCCENGYETTRVSATYNCDCTFLWCCEVKCKACQEWEAIARCRVKAVDVDEEEAPDPRIEKNIKSGYQKIPIGHWVQRHLISREEFNDPLAEPSKNLGNQLKFKNIPTSYIFHQPIISLGNNGYRRKESNWDLPST